MSANATVYLSAETPLLQPVAGGAQPTGRTYKFILKDNTFEAPHDIYNSSLLLDLAASKADDDAADLPVGTGLGCSIYGIVKNFRVSLGGSLEVYEQKEAGFVEDKFLRIQNTAAALDERRNELLWARKSVAAAVVAGAGSVEGRRLRSLRPGRTLEIPLRIFSFMEVFNPAIGPGGRVGLTPTMDVTFEFDIEDDLVMMFGTAANPADAGNATNAKIKISNPRMRFDKVAITAQQASNDVAESLREVRSFAFDHKEIIQATAVTETAGNFTFSTKFNSPKELYFWFQSNGAKVASAAIDRFKTTFEHPGGGVNLTKMIFEIQGTEIPKGGYVLPRDEALLWKDYTKGTFFPPYVFSPALTREEYDTVIGAVRIPLETSKLPLNAMREVTVKIDWSFSAPPPAGTLPTLLVKRGRVLKYTKSTNSFQLVDA